MAYLTQQCIWTSQSTAKAVLADVARWFRLSGKLDRKRHRKTKREEYSKFNFRNAEFSDHLLRDVGVPVEAHQRPAQRTELQSFNAMVRRTY